jgi:tetraspanin-9
MGLWLHLSNQGYATLYPNHMGLSAEYLFILIGALSLVISFFGCCGSFFESRCCLVIVSHWVIKLIDTLHQLEAKNMFYFSVFFTHHLLVFE